MNTHRKLNFFSTQNKKCKDFLQSFGMWKHFLNIVKFRQNLVR